MSKPFYRKRRQRPLEESGNVVYRALCAAGLSDQAKRLKIFQSWDEAVGSDIAARTMPQSFSRGCLVVKAATATWQNELVFLKSSIMAKLNTLLGKNMVKDLKIISGHLEPRREAAVAKQVNPNPEDFQVARETSMPIDDPDVKEAFERLMAKDRCSRRTPTPQIVYPAPTPSALPSPLQTAPVNSADSIGWLAPRPKMTPRR